MYLNPAPFVWITTSGIEPNPPVHETDMQTFTLCRTFILFFYSYNILFWIRTKIDTLEEWCSTIELRELKVKLRLTNKKKIWFNYLLYKLLFNYTSNQIRTDDIYLEGRGYTNLTILVFNFSSPSRFELGHP